MFLTAELNILSFVILTIILINAYNRSEKALFQNKMFIALIVVNMVMLAIDLLGWAFNGLSGALYFYLNSGFNFLLYVCAPIAPVLWLLYVHYQIYRDERRLRKASWYLFMVLLVNAVFMVINLFTGWVYYVDQYNVYHRGDLFFVHVAFCYAIIVYTIWYILIHRKKLDKRYFAALVLFFIPPTIGILTQAFFYGVSFNWIGMMLSILIIYLYIQNRSLNTDYLTGVYNRRQFESYAKERIRNSNEGNTFSAISIDLDAFKRINDTFGHDAGDEALKNAVAIIKKSIRQNDFIARLGGDEFIVILDISKQDLLAEAANRIRANVQTFNIENQTPYSISFSMGYDVYNSGSKSFDDFFGHIDMLMYEEKKKNKAAVSK